MHTSTRFAFNGARLPPGAEETLDCIDGATKRCVSFDVKVTDDKSWWSWRSWTLVDRPRRFFQRNIRHGGVYALREKDERVGPSGMMRSEGWSREGAVLVGQAMGSGSGSGSGSGWGSRL